MGHDQNSRLGPLPFSCCISTTSTKKRKNPTHSHLVECIRELEEKLFRSGKRNQGRSKVIDLGVYLSQFCLDAKMNRNKEQGKLDTIIRPSGSSRSPDDGKLSKQSVIANKGKEKMIEPPKKRIDFWESMPVRYPSKGIVIGSPPKSPPRVLENAMVSTKSKDKTPPKVRTEGKKPKRRNKQKNVVAPSCERMIYPQDVVDAGLHLNPEKKKRSVWFSLTPSCDQNRKGTLQLLVEPYVQIIIDGNCHPDVSILMKYIVLKLTHVCQNDVRIFMNGKLLPPKMKILDVVNQWMTVVGSERKITKIGGSAENFFVKLTYARRE